MKLNFIRRSRKRDVWVFGMGGRRDAEGVGVLFLIFIFGFEFLIVKCR